MSLRHHLRSAEGASVVEYALLIAGLAAIVVVAVFAIGRGAAAQIAKGGACLTSSVCPASPVAAPSSTPTAAPTAAAAPTPTPTPSSTRTSGGNNGNNNGTTGTTGTAATTTGTTATGTTATTDEALGSPHGIPGRSVRPPWEHL